MESESQLNPPTDIGKITRGKLDMAKLSAHGYELYRYFSPDYRGLLSIRSDGVTLIRYPGSNWKVKKRKKAEVSFEQWRAGRADTYARHPQWARDCQTLPSVEQINEWSTDSVCETIDGDTCEPDAPAFGTHGPSWLVALGYI